MFSTTDKLKIPLLSGSAREVLKLLRKGTDVDPLSHQCWPSQDLRELVLYEARTDHNHCCCALRTRERLWLGPSVQAGGPPHVCPVISLSGCEDATLVATVGAAEGVAGDAEDDPLQQFPILDRIYIYIYIHRNRPSFPPGQNQKEREIAL
ncbi:hypothetical protein F8388_025841 [Cannabis sativa]|uniref:Uncharacterized protein n=1 Tax=Cannabis sativa TaxID=3483 RepID=A0A7J6F9M1_CANSA|nr:hypothetical protein F8388_025841 [Cannabis sativa]